MTAVFAAGMDIGARSDLLHRGRHGRCNRVLGWLLADQCLLRTVRQQWTLADAEIDKTNRFTATVLCKRYLGCNAYERVVSVAACKLLDRPPGARRRLRNLDLGVKLIDLEIGGKEADVEVLCRDPAIACPARYVQARVQRQRHGR